MISLDSYLDGVHSVAIAGHVRPDGDCTGSCLAVYNYITDNYPEMEICLYLEPVPEKFLFLKNADQIVTIDQPEEKEYDLFIALDCGDADRLGKAARYFETAQTTLCVDHHISNQSFADFNYIFPHASSTSELVYELMEKRRITQDIAACIYLGIVHDTGVFQYSCTSSKTMRIAGELMDTGIDYSKIVDESYYIKTYAQTRAWGEAMRRSQLYLDGSCIYTWFSGKDMEDYQVRPKDLDGIVSQIRSVEGVETAIFLYENPEGGYKLSLRSCSYVDVAAIADKFGGGGHVRAAGASMQGTAEEILQQLLPEIELQMKKHDEEQRCITES